MSSQSATKADRPLPQVDLKGHTVEELALVANVSVDAIRKAIELRQKQLIAAQETQLKRQMEEEANQMRQRQEADIANQLAMYQYQQQQYLATSTPSSTVKSTTVAATTRQTTTRRPATTPRPIMAGGHKVISDFNLVDGLIHNVSFFPNRLGNERSKRILSSGLREELR